jgi:hypothetical protein
MTMPTRQQNGKKLAVALALLLSAAWHSGCGGDRPQTVPVDGKITFAGGPCPAEGYIDFQPLEAAPGYTTHPGSAQFGRDGQFAVTSFRAGDGLVPGRYRVHIECWKELPDEATFSPGVSYVPEGFQAPELVVEPTSSGPLSVTYDIPQS